MQQKLVLAAEEHTASDRDNVSRCGLFFSGKRYPGEIPEKTRHGPSIWLLPSLEHPLRSDVLAFRVVLIAIGPELHRVGPRFAMVTDDAAFSRGKRGMILRPALRPFEVYGLGLACAKAVS